MNKSCALRVTRLGLVLALALAAPAAGQAPPTDAKNPPAAREKPPLSTPRPQTPALQALPESGYHLPPDNLVKLVDAPTTPVPSISPDHKHLILLDQPALPPISELAERELRLAGFRIRPSTNGQSRAGYYTKLTLQALGDSTGRVITGLPAGARIQNVRWSPDGQRLAFTVTDNANIELWVTERDKDLTRRILRQRLNAAVSTPYKWLPDSKSLVALIVPEERGAEPPEPKVPGGPVVQETSGKEAQARTYQDLLKNAYDESLFDHYATGQLIRVDLGGKRKRLGEPGVIGGFDPSPDGRYLVVRTIHRPYSYVVPASRFGHRLQIWDMDGKLVHQLADVPLQEGVPVAFGSVPVGVREVGWREDAPATLAWAEAQDEGDARKDAEVRDKIFMLAAPFKGEPVTLATLSERFQSIRWGTDELASIDEWWWKTRNQKTWLVKPGKPGEKPALLYDRSFEDRYNDPGAFLSRTNEWGRDVLLTTPDGTSLYLSGEGATPEGNRPFLDRISVGDRSTFTGTLDTARKQTTRLWRADGAYYEKPFDILDPEAKRIVTRRESPEEQPNLYIRDLAANTLTQITRLPHPHPQLKGITKELIHYERADGVKLNGTLYLPPGYKKEDGPLPMLMWAYPEEFKSADAAGQVTDSPYRFDRVTGMSPLVWLTQGYAVLDNPTLPIVGEGDTEPNDTYVDQLRAGAEAAVKTVVERGVADPERIAVGGHSYGAFMTANLLAHTDLFRAGIARSGAYNRSLTPFGFQAEERTFWQARGVYDTMSPFSNAEKINEPILLIHGEADNNPGTFPMQSERFYAALKGLGKNARLVMLPYESHGYRARESVLHMLWESHRWLETYVKTATPREKAEASPGAEEKGD